MRKILLIIWIISVLGFTAYKVHEYLERQNAIERGRAQQVQPSVKDTVSEESGKTAHTVIPSSDRFFTKKKKVYTNEDIRKLNEKKKKKGVITNEEIKKYHKE